MNGTPASATARARNVVLAAYLGWTLDAFDFFILIFTFDDAARTFGVGIEAMSVAITLTLAMRAVGALIFGRLADHIGRKPTLMLVILLYSLFEGLSGLAWSYVSFLVLRTLFGIAMGGEWGVGSALAMETIPVSWRGWVSGLLQAGYPSGYFLATLLFGLLYDHIGWRGMFFVGAAPAILVFFISRAVEESPVYHQLSTRERTPLLTVLGRHLGLTLFAMVLMTAFNFFSHGTQDIYPKLFLGAQRHFSHGDITTIALIYNVGAIVGGLFFGWLSQKLGRRLAIGLASLLALVVVYPWSHGTTVASLAAAAFLMQFAVQGAWGVVPVYLNELSPAEIRGTFPGFVYQFGNFLASYNAPLQVMLAAHYGGDYGFALMAVAATVAVVLILLMLVGREAHGVAMSHD
jgi:SHS family lactate transporter-like MFS transporter